MPNFSADNYGNVTVKLKKDSTTVNSKKATCIQRATVFVQTLHAFTSAQWSNIVIHSHTYFFKTQIHARSSAMLVENEDEDDPDADFLMALK